MATSLVEINQADVFWRGSLMWHWRVVKMQGPVAQALKAMKMGASPLAMRSDRYAAGAG